MIRVRTGSRLHFGLFTLPSANATAWLNHDGAPTLARRKFGGVGLMVDRPGIELTVEPAQRWSADGPLAERALRFAQEYCQSVGISEAFHVRIASASPEHAGLGTGTQLGLAVAKAIAEYTGQPLRDAVSLAQCVGRGLRSAIGIHGFEHGGFLVDAGKTSQTAIAPLLAHLDFPANWHIMLITLRGLTGTHGGRELEAFAQLANQVPDERTTDILCRLVLLGMMPAIMERDLAAFGEAVCDFNRRVGVMFRSAQGGAYAHPRIGELVRALREAGVKGVGQSSWGPTVFAIIEARQEADLSTWLTRKWGLANEEIIVTTANGGAVVTK